ncbi:hypothetical protein [Streptomyces sulphureus]|uniref:hypothetical protein n=1 Tax=Streptomyces sulphureus TaxID=47758 RepID=UPI00037D5781|nr:hypothetical protein [Streptomyces sulphureus]
MFRMFVFVRPLILLAVLAFGWIENLAARRRPRLLPTRSRGTARRAGGRVRCGLRVAYG